MRRVYEIIQRVAASSVTVILTGESGTGKEVAARTIHDFSKRRSGPFEAVNCGAISPHLIESELFGHERGSVTGADRRHRGHFERASGGTVFLDEIAEMSTETQVKLLRVLETGVFTRVGGETGIKMDARVIAATNEDIHRAMRDGKLREDLYYRLKVLQIYLPPLRDRIEDLELLVGHFLDRIAAIECVRKRFDNEALEALRRYSWPGNVRELRNVVHSASILAPGDVIDTSALPPEIREGGHVATLDTSQISIPIGLPLAEVERRVLLATLASHDGDKRKTAATLGISLKTLYTRLRQYDQRVPHA